MDEELICPINPHGNGYCKREKCALWKHEVKDQFYGECSFSRIIWHLSDISDSLNELESIGITVYEGE